MDLTHVYYLHEIGGKKNQEDYIWPVAGTASLHQNVFIVCDGVGGSDNGEIASRIIAESVGKGLLKTEGTEISVDLVNKLLREAQQELVKYAVENRLNTDMATTFTLLVLTADKAFVAWCGDSRIYHLRNGEILYKTSDHSLVNSLVKNGEITEEEALIHPRRNIILRAIKADGAVIEADYHFIDNVANGDYFMLCTDGLLENVTDKDLKFLLTQNEKGNIDLVQAFQQFCLGKTKDNYSMYLLKVKLQPKPSRYKKKILALTLFFVLLIAASALIFSQYFEIKKEIKKAVVSVPVDTAKPPVADSFISPVATAPPIEEVALVPVTAAPATLKMPDSAVAKKPVVKKQRDSPTLIVIDQPEIVGANQEETKESSAGNKKDTTPKPKAIMPAKDTTQHHPLP